MGVWGKGRIRPFDAGTRRPGDTGSKSKSRIWALESGRKCHSCKGGKNLFNTGYTERPLEGRITGLHRGKKGMEYGNKGVWGKYSVIPDTAEQ